MNGNLEHQFLNKEIRLKSDTYPKGHGVFIKHNSGNRSYQNEIIWLRNFRIYVQ